MQIGIASPHQISLCPLLPVLNGYTKKRNHRKTLRKTQKQQSTETKRIVNTKIQTMQGPTFYIQLGGGWQFAPLTRISYATDQVHFKHEQSQVLLIESHVEIGTIQQTQDAASVL